MNHSVLRPRAPRWLSATAVAALTATSLTVALGTAAPAGAATLPATYAAQSASTLLHLNAGLAGTSIADAMVGLSSADVDSSRPAANSTATSANVNATVLGIKLPIDQVSATAAPTVPSHSRTLLPVDLSPVANVGVINGQLGAAYVDQTSCVTATNGTAVLSSSRTDVAGVTLLSSNAAVNTALSTLGINSLGSVAASWVASETDLINRGGGSTISNVRSTSATSIGDVTLLNNAVKVHVASPVVLQANSDGTTGTAGLLNVPTITATIGSTVIPIPLNGQPINIALPGTLAAIASLSITAFQPTDASSGASGAATLQSLLRVQLSLLSGTVTADVNLAPMAVTATAPTGGVDCKPATATITAPAAGSVTNNASPTITGTAGAGTTVTVTEGATTICTATVAADGSWFCTPATALPDGQQTLTAVSTNTAGMSSTPATTTFTVDTLAPDAPVITGPADGSIQADGASPISGTAEAGSTVTVKDGSTTICSATANSSGVWTCTPATALADGSHTLTATATDGAGNTSAPSGPIHVTVAPPAAPVISTPAPGSTIATGFPAVTGTGAPGGTIIVYDGSAPICTATVAANGTWICTPTTKLSDGVHGLTATETSGGRTSAPSAQVRFTIDTKAPAAPVITAPVNGSQITGGQPAIKGTAEAGSTVRVRQGSSVICTARANSAGAWACTPGTALPVGAHTITATATDAVGNVSAPSARDTFTVTQRTYIGLTWDHNPLKVGGSNRITFATHPAADVTGKLTIRITGAGLNISKTVTLTHAMGGVVTLYVKPTKAGTVTVQASYAGNSTCRPSSVKQTFTAR